MNNRFFVRADGNGEIGLGHIMRSMTIANEFRKNGFECIYISSKPISLDIFNRYSFDVVEIDYPYDSKSISEAMFISRLLNKQDYILVDSYYTKNEYLSILKEAARLICINSTTNRLTTDYLINENLACDRDFLGELYSGSDTKLLLGPEYSPIREEFLNVDFHVRTCAKTVLITTGGGDYYNFMGRFIEKIRYDQDFMNINFICVSGACNDHLSDLIRATDGLDNVSVIQNPSNMAELMRICDFAISGGGTTVLELSVVGVPTIGIAIADDQEAGLSFMSHVGMIKYVGRINKKGFWENLLKEFDSMKIDYEMRKTMSLKASNCIDGYGAKRIYEQVVGV